MSSSGDMSLSYVALPTGYSLAGSSMDSSDGDETDGTYSVSSSVNYTYTFRSAVTGNPWIIKLLYGSVVVSSLTGSFPVSY